MELPKGVRAVWDLEKAHREATARRERVCINGLWRFRPAAGDLLASLVEHPERRAIVLTNSLGDKVERHLATLALAGDVAVLGDTRQYDMDPDWTQRFMDPELGEIQVWPVSERRRIDLRRPVYYRALMEAAADAVNTGSVSVTDTPAIAASIPLR